MIEKRGVVPGEGDQPNDKQAADQAHPSCGDDVLSKLADDIEAFMKDRTERKQPLPHFPAPQLGKEPRS